VSIEDGAFFGLNNLKVLILELNYGITSLTQRMFIGLPNLEEFNLADCSMGRIMFNTFKYIPNIVSIDLSGNKIANIDDNAFQGLNRISQLDLSYNSLMTKISKNSFRGLKT
jgi:Leucine-rich repeat (LRR) protein